jgi:hypothetical protein
MVAMLYKYLTYLLLLPATILGATFFMNASYIHASTCLQLNSDLSYSMSDQSPSQSIYLLQGYLHGLGYLTATPNGHFGPSTLAAVKAFQTANGITATGYVGSLTRTSISGKTCSVGTSVNTSTNTSSVQSVSASSQTCPVGYVCTANTQSTSVAASSNQTIANNVSATTNTSSNMTVTSPMTGQVLSIGSSVAIRWNVSPTSDYNIVLEQPGGIGAGFVAQSLSSNTNNNQYLWNVGKIFSSDMNSNQSVAAGTYRIRLESVSSGALSTDPVSGWFTIVAPQFVVNSVVPSSAYADNATSVVLFGSGFTTSASVYFGTNYSSLRADNTYVSPDGTVLVFTVPTTVPAGSYTLFINNGAGSSPSKLPFVVSSIQ